MPRDADLIITTGGVSAGAYEVVKDSLGEEVEFVKVAMQPGMPQGAGSGRRGDCPIITLPGNPVSALVSFEVFIRAPLRAAMGLPHPDRPRRTATLTESLTSPRGKRQFRRGVLDADSDTVTSYGPPASHHLRWLASANCLLEIDEDVVELAAGFARAGVGPGASRPGRARPYRRIEAPWPDQRDHPTPPTNPSSHDWSISSDRPFRPCTPQACRSSRAASASPPRAAATAGCAPPGLTAAAACARFFRHPPRVPPTRPGLVVAPADGRVTLIDEVAPPAELEPARRRR